MSFSVLPVKDKPPVIKGLSPAQCKQMIYTGLIPNTIILLLLLDQKEIERGDTGEAGKLCRDCNAGLECKHRLHCNVSFILLLSQVIELATAVPLQHLKSSVTAYVLLRKNKAA